MNETPVIEAVRSIDERAARAHRAHRIRHELRRQQHEAVLVVDPINLTHLIGPMGFYNDLSRSWVIGGRRPTRTQATLLDLAREQIAHNIDLLCPGTSFVECASRAFRLPDPYLANRYADLVHGCGLGVEYPFVLYPEDADGGMYDGRFEANAIVCVESCVGAQGGPEGVELEEPILITENGPEVLSALPLDAADF